MKIRHRIPPQAHFVSDEITPGYQAQVDATVASAEARHAAAERRLVAAEMKLQKAERIKAKVRREHAVAVARELIEMRRAELVALHQQMNGSPAAAANRGNRSAKRAVPGMKVI